MAVEETVQEFVTNLKQVQDQIAEKQEKLEELRKTHLEFWENFQQKCRETGHSLTQEEKDALSNPKEYPLGKLTVFEFHMNKLRARGYRCPYCLRKEQGFSEDFRSDLDLCKRESFSDWLSKENWPPEKVDALTEAKKEVEDFFEKAEPLEHSIETLKNEEKKIQVFLEPIWKLLDEALGKAAERDAERKKLEEIIKELEGREFELYLISP